MPKNKGKRAKNRRRGKEEADGEKIKEDGLEIKSPPLSTDPRRASQMSPKSPSERSTDPEKQSVLGKICIICRGLPDFKLLTGSVDDVKRWHLDISLFLLDLDAEWEGSSDVPVNPTMCISSFRLGVRAFCVLGSTLYLFGNEKKEVFSYDLSLIPPVPSSPPEELTVDKLSTSPPDMTYRKICPIGCQTPDGKKMIVFSSTFFVDEESIGNFELFDGDKWIELPDLHPLLRGLGSDSIVYVISYSFIIDDEPLLLITTEVGNFTLNIEQLDRGWSRWKDLKLPKYGCGLAMLVRDSWCLMDWFEWVDGTEPKLSHPWKTDGYYMSGGGITWLSPLNCFCVLRSHMETETMRPRLTVDVRGFDDEASGPKLKKRIEFVVGLRMHDFFIPALLHPMKKEGA